MKLLMNGGNGGWINKLQGKLKFTIYNTIIKLFFFCFSKGCFDFVGRYTQGYEHNLTFLTIKVASIYFHNLFKEDVLVSVTSDIYSNMSNK